MRNLLILISLIAFLAPLAAFAQAVPPVPRPRPNRGEPVMEPQAQPVAQPVQTQTPENTALDAVTAIVRDQHTVQGPPQPVTLSAKITEEGAVIPNGLVWRIFDTKTNASGQLTLLEKSEDSIPVFNLSPGDYVIHVAYGLSQATNTMHVETGSNSKILVLDSGALQLNAAITGDLGIATAALRFEIFATGEGDQDRALVAGNVRPNDIIHLNAGVYHIVSHYGSVNAQVRADLRVEPGQLTEATLYHRASEVGFKLVSEEGGEAIADVDWTVKNTSGETIYNSFGAFPSTVLATGDYTILAKRGTNVYNRDFQVQAGKKKEIEVITTIY